jgi:uncharacterized membrane protein YphA (DoxX/SURF4 family)
MTSQILHTTETVPSSTTTALGRHLPTVARFLLGAVFFVFGLNGFLNFIPPPPEGMPQGAVDLGTAFMKSGYLFQLIKGTEVLGGVLLLGNRFVPLALVVLAPVVVNIVAFHLWLVPSGMGLSLAVLGLELYLAWVYRRAYAPLLSAKTPTAR